MTIVIALATLMQGLIGLGTSAPSFATEGAGGLFVSAKGRIATSLPVSGSWTVVNITGVGGLPTSGVSAVDLILSVTSPSSSGYVQVLPSDATSAPTTTSLSYVAGRSESNMATVAVGADGKVWVRASSAVSLTIDAEGYYTSGGSVAGGYTPIAPTRVVDTRNGTGLSTRISPGTSTVQVADNSSVPAGAAAVIVNITLINPSAAGAFKAYAAGAAAPTSQVGFPATLYNSTSIVVPLAGTGTNAGAFSLTLIGASTDLTVDVSGYFNPGGTGTGGTFRVATARLLDTRSSASIAAGSFRDLRIDNTGGVPAAGEFGAVMVHLIAVPSEASGYLAAYDSNGEEPPVSTLNFQSGITASDTTIVGIGRSGTMRIANRSSQPVDILVDLQGWFTPRAPDDLGTVDYPAVTGTYTPSDAHPADASDDEPDAQAGGWYLSGSSTAPQSARPTSGGYIHCEGYANKPHFLAAAYDYGVFEGGTRCEEAGGFHEGHYSCIKVQEKDGAGHWYQRHKGYYCSRYTVNLASEKSSAFTCSELGAGTFRTREMSVVDVFYPDGREVEIKKYATSSPAFLCRGY